MNQAGVYKIDLFENKGAVINYNNYTVTTQGYSLTFSNLPRLEIEPKRQTIDYVIRMQKESLLESDLSILARSIYGFIAVLTMLDGSKKIIDRPFFKASASELKTNISHTRDIALKAWNKLGLINFS